MGSVGVSSRPGTAGPGVDVDAEGWEEPPAPNRDDPWPVLGIDAADVEVPIENGASPANCEGADGREFSEGCTCVAEDEVVVGAVKASATALNADFGEMGFLSAVPVEKSEAACVGACASAPEGSSLVRRSGDEA